MIRFTLYFIKTIITIIATLLVTSCNINFNGMETIMPKGDVVKKQILLNQNFDAIKVSNSINVILTQNNQTDVTVEAQENLLEYITITVEENTLVVKKDKNFGFNSTANVFISAPNIEKIKASSASNVNVTSQLKVSNLELEVSSAATIDLDVIAKNIEIESSSGSEINITGKVVELNIQSSSGSNVNAENLLSKNAEIKTSSGSTVKANVIENLNAKASSGSDIYYSKTPLNLISKISSGGNINMN